MDGARSWEQTAWNATSMFFWMGGISLSVVGLVITVFPVNKEVDSPFPYAPVQPYLVDIPGSDYRLVLLTPLNGSQGQSSEQVLNHLANTRPLLLAHGHRGGWKQGAPLMAALTMLERTESDEHVSDFDWAVYTIDFQEQPSGLHPSLVEDQAKFILDSIKEIMVMYEEGGVTERRIILVGHSLGGLDILRAATLDPYLFFRRVSTILLLNCPTSGHHLFSEPPAINFMDRLMLDLSQLSASYSNLVAGAGLCSRGSGRNEDGCSSFCRLPSSFSNDIICPMFAQAALFHQNKCPSPFCVAPFIVVSVSTGSKDQHVPPLYTRLPNSLRESFPSAHFYSTGIQDVHRAASHNDVICTTDFLFMYRRLFKVLKKHARGVEKAFRAAGGVHMSEQSRYRRGVALSGALNRSNTDTMQTVRDLLNSPLLKLFQRLHPTALHNWRAGSQTGVTDLPGYINPAYEEAPPWFARWLNAKLMSRDKGHLSVDWSEAFDVPVASSVGAEFIPTNRLLFQSAAAISYAKGSSIAVRLWFRDDRQPLGVADSLQEKDSVECTSVPDNVLSENAQSKIQMTLLYCFCNEPGLSFRLRYSGLGGVDFGLCGRNVCSSSNRRWFVVPADIQSQRPVKLCSWMFAHEVQAQNIQALGNAVSDGLVLVKIGDGEQQSDVRSVINVVDLSSQLAGDVGCTAGDVSSEESLGVNCGTSSPMEWELSDSVKAVGGWLQHFCTGSLCEQFMLWVTSAKWPLCAHVKLHRNPFCYLSWPGTRAAKREGLAFLLPYDFSLQKLESVGSTSTVSPTIRPLLIAHLTTGSTEHNQLEASVIQRLHSHQNGSAKITSDCGNRGSEPHGSCIGYGSGAGCFKPRFIQTYSGLPTTAVLAVLADSNASYHVCATGNMTGGVVAIFRSYYDYILMSVASFAVFSLAWICWQEEETRHVKNDISFIANNWSTACGILTPSRSMLPAGIRMCWLLLSLVAAQSSSPPLPVILLLHIFGMCICEALRIVVQAAVGTLLIVISRVFMHDRHCDSRREGTTSRIGGEGERILFSQYSDTGVSDCAPSRSRCARLWVTSLWQFTLITLMTQTALMLAATLLVMVYALCSCTSVLLAEISPAGSEVGSRSCKACSYPFKTGPRVREWEREWMIGCTILCCLAFRPASLLHIFWELFSSFSNSNNDSKRFTLIADPWESWLDWIGTLLSVVDCTEDHCTSHDTMPLGFFERANIKSALSVIWTQVYRAATVSG
eukprot:GHVS01082049.1.p1 GENE.GHVS01082049.1~~GHVS01082049.1.p1  ORF type:complete len:1238 (+),score=78.50 GHVS01082049.1:247-3960(+)